MEKSSQRKHEIARSRTVGGQWLSNLLIWGGTLLMLTGGVMAYPTIQSHLAPQNAANLEFAVTLSPSASVAVVQPTPASVGAVQSTPEAEATLEPSPCPDGQCEGEERVPQAEAATPTWPPPLILPETKLLAEEETPAAPASPAEEEIKPEATPEPSPTPPPTPTPDPASLIPQRLLIPAIELDTSIERVGWETREINGQLVSSWIVPNYFAAGWHATSAPPGVPGNTVLNGHHNIYGEVFRDLEDLQPGDEIVVYTGEMPHYYAVTERHILKEKYESEEVRRENAQFIMPTDDERLTIVTCWPYTNNTHRLIIVALPTQPELPIPIVE